jgi:SAM-dependent methyltransferase
VNASELPPGLEALAALVRCPRCREALPLIAGEKAVCPGCGDVFPWTGRTWRLVPSTFEPRGALWEAWDQVQANGLVSYTEDPTRNLAVGPRPDCRAFGRFCSLRGRVLDVGCGPQPWPAYFDEAAPDAFLLGVDPLVGDEPAGYWKLEALGEFLPFAAGVFDRVLFSTSLDHFVDPAAPLAEAARVCAPQGAICVWLGEKRPDAPKPTVSPAWYASLRKPEHSDDVFHIKRLRRAEFEQIRRRVGLVVEAEEVQRVDAWRTNYFLRLRVAAP